MFKKFWRDMANLGAMRDIPSEISSFEGFEKALNTKGTKNHRFLFVEGKVREKLTEDKGVQEVSDLVEDILDSGGEENYRMVHNIYTGKKEKHYIDLYSGSGKNPFGVVKFYREN